MKRRQRIVEGVDAAIAGERGIVAEGGREVDIVVRETSCDIARKAVAVAGIGVAKAAKAVGVDRNALLVRMSSLYF